MIKLSELYPSKQPNPHGPVFMSEYAWEEALEFSRQRIKWPPDADHDQAVGLAIQELLNQFYLGDYYSQSAWFRSVPKHSICVLASSAGFALRQIGTLCTDGVVLVSFGETYGDQTYGLDDSYFARRVTEELLISDPDAFSRSIN